MTVVTSKVPITTQAVEDQLLHNRQQRFVRLLNAAQRRSRRTCVAVADLSGIALSYLTELLAGRKHLVSLRKLRRLCEDGWQLGTRESLQLFEARLALDPYIKAPLPPEFFWRLSAFDSVASFARQVGIERSHMTKIMQGTRVPSYLTLLQICQALSYDPRRTALFYLACVKATHVGSKLNPAPLLSSRD